MISTFSAKAVEIDAALFFAEFLLVSLLLLHAAGLPIVDADLARPYENAGNGVV